MFWANGTLGTFAEGKCGTTALSQFRLFFGAPKQPKKDAGPLHIPCYFEQNALAYT